MTLLFCSFYSCTSSDAGTKHIAAALCNCFERSEKNTNYNADSVFFCLQTIEKKFAASFNENKEEQLERLLNEMKKTGTCSKAVAILQAGLSFQQRKYVLKTN